MEKKSPDLCLFIVVILLMAVGLCMVFSSSYIMAYKWYENITLIVTGEIHFKSKDGEMICRYLNHNLHLELNNQYFQIYQQIKR